MSRKQKALLSPSVLLVLSAALALKVGVLCLLKKYYTQDPYGVIASNRDYPRTFPVGALPDVRMFIEDTVHFKLEDDVEWDALTPGSGLVYMGDAGEPFTPSIFHQLRCLNIIRKAVVDLEASGTNETAIPSELSHHCVNYLRQMVLCRGDLELDPVLGKPFPNVYPDTYRCKDWKAVYRAVEENQIRHQTRM